MIDLLQIVTWALALVELRWFILLACVVAAALGGRARGRRPAPAAAGATRFLVLIPAHDEAPVVGVTVRSCLAVDYDPDRFQVCVIADNCTDETAAVAAGAGALVVVRTDAARRSKGFALEDFFDGAIVAPAVRPPDAYVLVDADTSVDPDILRAFDRSLARGDDFVQGYYSVRNAAASWRTRLMTYAFSLANGVWLAGLDRLGLGVGLKGNGMCFRAAALRRTPWRAYGLVEDMEFAWNLRVGGERVRFQPEARVYGEMVSRGGAGAASQRRRWESGRRALRATFRPLIAQSRRLAGWQKVAYRIDLDFPPLGRLAVGLGLVTLLAGLDAAWAGSTPARTALLALAAAEWIALLGYMICPTVIMGLPVSYLASLVYVPYYLGWKLAVGLLKAPQQWIRTPREATTPR